MLLIYLSFVLLKSVHIDKLRNHQKIRFRKNRYKDISNDIMTMLEENEKDNVFKDTGLRVTTVKYNILRIFIFIVFLLGMLITYLKSGTDVFKYIVTLISIMLITAPKMYFLGKTTLFGIIIKTLKKEYQMKKNVEIYRAITQLKNLAIAQEVKPLGADFIIEQLTKFTVITKPIFTQTLSLWRLGKEEEACQYFAGTIGTKLGKEFSNILIKLDQINPVELVDQLVLYQNHIKEERITLQLRRNEIISNIIFIPIVASAFAIMLNFVTIVVWMDSMKSIINL